MPELPEVETVRRVLSPMLIGKKITATEVYRPVTIPPAEEFASSLVDKRFKDVLRRGKYLICEFEDGANLVVHMRMTGALVVLPSDYPLEKHTHVSLRLDDGNELRFNDPRRFGRMWLTDSAYSLDGVKKLGIEPQSEELTGAYLKAAAHGRNPTIKQFLLDQTVIAGVGNIYSDEICFAAGIRPDRRLNTLSDGEWELIAEKTAAVIENALDDNEIDGETFNLSGGREYRNTPKFNVYGRGGMTCKRCGAPLEKTVIGGRSSCFCPRCQK